jgi:hypothetical protein
MNLQDSEVFLNCPLLEYIEMESDTPPTLNSSTFNGANTTFVIYVPDSAVNDYKDATGWIGYADRILPVSQKPA